MNKNYAILTISIILSLSLAEEYAVECDRGLLQQAIMELLETTPTGLSLMGMGRKLLRLADRDERYASLAALNRTPEGHLFGKANFTWTELRILLSELTTKKIITEYSPLTLAPQPLIIYCVRRTVYPDKDQKNEPPR